MYNYVVQLSQKNQTLYVPLKGIDWTYNINDAGMFGEKEAIVKANKQKRRFSFLELLTPPPPAGPVVIKILKLEDITNKVISETIV